MSTTQTKAMLLVVAVIITGLFLALTFTSHERADCREAVRAAVEKVDILEETALTMLDFQETVPFLVENAAEGNWDAFDEVLEYSQELLQVQVAFGEELSSIDGEFETLAQKCLE